MMVLGKVAVKSALWTRHRDIVGSIEASLSDQKQAGGGFFIIDCWSWFDEKKKRRKEEDPAGRSWNFVWHGPDRISAPPVM